MLAITEKKFEDLEEDFEQVLSNLEDRFEEYREEEKSRAELTAHVEGGLRELQNINDEISDKVQEEIHNE